MLIHNAILVDRKGTRRGWLKTDGEIITLVGSGDPTPFDLFDDDEIIDAEGAYVCPGLIDSHVHFREPGLEHKATIAGESRAALAGGLPPSSTCPTPYRPRLRPRPCGKRISSDRPQRPHTTVPFSVPRRGLCRNWQSYVRATHRALKSFWARRPAPWRRPCRANSRT